MIKRRLRCRGYVRYVDDFLLFGDDPGQLVGWRERIVAELERFRMTLHEERAQVRPVTVGIPWLGFVVYPSGRRLKRRKVVHFRRRLGLAVRRYHRGEIDEETARAMFQGWEAHAAHGNTVRLRAGVKRSFEAKLWRAGR